MYLVLPEGFHHWHVLRQQLLCSHNTGFQPLYKIKSFITFNNSICIASEKSLQNIFIFMFLYYYFQVQQGQQLYIKAYSITCTVTMYLTNHYVYCYNPPFNMSTFFFFLTLHCVYIIFTSYSNTTVGLFVRCSICSLRRSSSLRQFSHVLM